MLGVDAAGRHGWVGVLVDESGFCGARTGAFGELIEWSEPVLCVGVDIPIGHAGSGPRLADLEARRFVGPRGSSVFPAPPPEALRAETYEEANSALAAAGRPRISRQAWNLMPGMKEVELVARSDPRVHEVHPEVSFRHLAGEELSWSKKTWNGLLLRRRLLRGAGVELPDVLEEVVGAAADDVVDAAAVAWSARRIATGDASALPDPPEVDGTLEVAIWY